MECIDKNLFSLIFVHEANPDRRRGQYWTSCVTKLEYTQESSQQCYPSRSKCGDFQNISNLLVQQKLTTIYYDFVGFPGVNESRGWESLVDLDNYHLSSCTSLQFTLTPIIFSNLALTKFQAPIFLGSSCAQTKALAFANDATSFRRSSAGKGHSSSSLTMATESSNLRRWHSSLSA